MHDALRRRRRRRQGGWASSGPVPSKGEEGVGYDSVEASPLGLGWEWVGGECVVMRMTGQRVRHAGRGRCTASAGVDLPQVNPAASPPSPPRQAPDPPPRGQHGGADGLRAGAGFPHGWVGAGAGLPHGWGGGGGRALAGTLLCTGASRHWHWRQQARRPLNSSSGDTAWRLRLRTTHTPSPRLCLARRRRAGGGSRAASGVRQRAGAGDAAGQGGGGAAGGQGRRQGAHRHHRAAVPGAQGGPRDRNGTKREQSTSTARW